MVKWHFELSGLGRLQTNYIDWGEHYEVDTEQEGFGALWLVLSNTR